MGYPVWTSVAPAPAPARKPTAAWMALTVLGLALIVFPMQIGHHFPIPLLRQQIGPPAEVEPSLLPYLTLSGMSLAFIGAIGLLICGQTVALFATAGAMLSAIFQVLGTLGMIGILVGPAMIVLLLLVAVSSAVIESNRVSGHIVRPSPPPPRNRLALASLACGMAIVVLTVALVLAPFTLLIFRDPIGAVTSYAAWPLLAVTLTAIPLGHLARRQIARTAERGAVAATGGLALGYMGVAGVIQAVLSAIW